MPVSQIVPIACLAGLLALCVGPALAADPPERHCLTKAEQRQAVAGNKAMPLAEVMKNRRAQGHRGELVRARLCHRGDGLAYVLTLLGRSGRVVSATVDAANGELINSR